jgi:acyl dehydratase
MTERYLEDFAVGQTFGSGRMPVESEVLLEVRPAKSPPEQGLIKVRTATKNQNGELVQVSVGNPVVPRGAT